MANTFHFLDFAISLVFIFTLVSVLCSVVVEWISQRLRRREAYLRSGLQRLIQDPGLYVRVVNHPTIIASSGRREGRGGPSYLSGAAFADALLDSIVSRVTQLNAVSGVRDGRPPDGIAAAVHELERWGSMSARALRPMLSSAPSDAEIKTRVAAWYDQSMERIAGTYKRGTQAWLFWMGFVVAAGLNIDTLAISRELWRNREATEAIAASAVQAVESGDLERMLREEQDPAAVKETLGNTIAVADIPLGYECTADAEPWSECLDAFRQLRFRDMVAILIGWLLTGIAVSFGATFWFDLLAKIVNVRSAGQRPAKVSQSNTGETRR